MKQTSAVAWPIVAILMAFTFLNYVNRVGMADAGEQIRATYKISETTFGTIISAFLLAYAVCMIPGGWFSDRFGARAALATMGIGTAIFGALTAVVGLAAPSSLAGGVLVMLWISRAGMGAFTAPLFPAAGRVVTNWVPFGRRARVNAIVVGAAMTGIAFSHPICGALIDTFSWPTAILLLAAATALLTIIWVVLGRDAPTSQTAALQPSKATGSNDDDAIAAVERELARRVPFLARRRLMARFFVAWRPVLTNRSLWLLAISYATVGYVEYVIFYWSADYFKKVLHLSEWGDRVAAMAPPLCMAACIPLGGWLCDWLMPRVGYRPCRSVVAMAGMIASAFFLILATVVTHDLAIVACISLSLAMMGLTEAPAWATAIDLGGQKSASSAAFANTGGNLGGIVSPVATPWISALLVSQFQITEQAGWGWALRFAALICLLGSVLWIWIDAGERR